MAENNVPDSVHEVLKLQQDMRARFEARLGKDGLPRTKKPEDLIELRGEDLVRAKAALAEAENQRNATVKYWDDRVSRLQARVDRQTTEIKTAVEVTRKAIQKPKPAAKKK